jgi:hypothetical protein
MPPLSQPLSTFSYGLLGGAAATILNQNYNFETGVTPWTATAGTTVTQSPAYAKLGSFSAYLNTPGAISNVAATSENTIPIVAGQTYTFTAFMINGGQVIGGTTQNVGWTNVVLNINWQTAAHAAISTSSSQGYIVQSLTTAVLGSVTAVAPGTAAFCTISVELAGSPGATNNINFDLAAIVQGSSGAFAPAGLTVVYLTPPPQTIYEIDTVAVNTGSLINTSACKIYSGGNIQPVNFQGSPQPNGDSGQLFPTAPFKIYQGQFVFAQWTGGDLGANATLTIYGNKITRYRAA